MSVSDEYLLEIISKVAEICKLKNWRHSIKNFGTKGQNYFGIVIPVSLLDEQKLIPIVLKLAPTDERYRVSEAVTFMFHREIFVYTKLLKTYLLTQRSFAPEVQYIIPKLYYTRSDYCKEVIVMEDMTQSGYQPYVDKTFLDLEHVNVALKALARLHGLSFIMQAKDLKFYDEVSKVCSPLSESSAKRYMEIMKDRLDKALTQFEGTRYVELLTQLRNYCGSFFDKAINLAENKCVGHGDVWKENILFKYEKNTPVSACLIDYQTTRIASPAFDVIYLIISSTSTELRRDNFNNLINIYYSTLIETLKLEGLDNTKVYSIDNFQADLKTVAPACLIVANTAMWLWNGLQQEGHVRSKRQWTTEEEKNTAVATYKSIVQAIIDDFYRYGYLPV